MQRILQIIFGTSHYAFLEMRRKPYYHFGNSVRVWPQAWNQPPCLRRGACPGAAFRSDALFFAFAFDARRTCAGEVQHYRSRTAPFTGERCAQRRMGDTAVIWLQDYSSATRRRARARGIWICRMTYSTGGFMYEKSTLRGISCAGGWMTICAP